MNFGWPRAQLLTSPRLLLEPLTVEHAAEMVDVLASPELYRYIGGVPPTLDQLIERYRRQVTGHSPDGEQGWLNWIIRVGASGASGARGDSADTGGAVGFVQTTLARRRSVLSAEIAWLTAPAHQGHGVATDAAQRMCGWLRQQDVGTFVAHIAPENAASVGVARRLGMTATDSVVDGEVRWEVAASDIVTAR